MMSLRAPARKILQWRLLRRLIPFAPAIAYLLVTQWPVASTTAGRWLGGDAQGAMLVLLLVIGRLWLWLVLPAWLAYHLYARLDERKASTRSCIDDSTETTSL